MDRRRFLQLAAATTGAMAAAAADWSDVAAAAAVRRARLARPAGSDLGAVEHVIFLMMENRSFDHYYGSYRGVRGFDDHPRGDPGVFAQPYPANRTRPPRGTLLPFHLDTVDTDIASCTFDLTHDWGPQHQCRNGGRMDSFVRVHTSSANEGPDQGVLTMGYYKRADLRFYYALADAFTICDGYHCSVLGPTDPNRMMQISGTIDPGGHGGGPVLTTNSSPAALFSVRWDTMPEVLEDAGITWKYYRPVGDLYSIETMQRLGTTIDGTLPQFAQYSNPTSTLYQKAFMPTFPDEFAHDVATGQLPQVSWLSTPVGFDEHPPAPSFLGEWFTSQVLGILTAHPEVWSRTVLFHMYDENDGFFDHVAPPVPESGTPGEFLTVDPLPVAAAGIAGPIGLGFRVPMLVLSPFSRGGRVVSTTLDHTSQLRFLEERFGVRAPHLSAWRRRTVGDLTTTLRFGSPDTSVPSLPATTGDPNDAPMRGCTTDDILEFATDQPSYPIPTIQRMPIQEL